MRLPLPRMWLFAVTITIPGPSSTEPAGPLAQGVIVVTYQEARDLPVGARILWEYTGPPQRDTQSPCGATVVSRTHYGVVLSWDDGQPEQRFDFAWAEFWPYVSMEESACPTE